MPSFEDRTWMSEGQLDMYHSITGIQGRASAEEWLSSLRGERKKKLARWFVARRPRALGIEHSKAILEASSTKHVEPEDALLIAIKELSRFWLWMAIVIAAIAQTMVMDYVHHLEGM